MGSVFPPNCVFWAFLKTALFCLQKTSAEEGNPSLPQSLPTGEGSEPLAAKEPTPELHLQIRENGEPTVPSVVFDKFP